MALPASCTTRQPRLLNALTIDVEEYFQVHNMERVVHRGDWDAYPRRVAGNTRRVLALLKESGVRATFFVLGWVAAREPELVREIQEGGHEVATHGYWHELIYRLTPGEFADDLERSLDVIEEACGARPVGYRAPSFSITRSSSWAVDVLERLGIRFDSSILPEVPHPRYGLRGASRFASRLPGGLWEIPVSTVHVAGRNWPVAGGGYFRLYPFCLTRRAVRHLNAEAHPAVVYLHPWEFDPEQPRIVGLSWSSRFRHYVNLGRTEARLRALLREFDFGSITQAFAPAMNAPSAA